MRADPTELFQIWLNLPAKNKMAAPHFTMFWSEDLVRQTVIDANGQPTRITSIAGTLDWGPLPACTTRTPGPATPGPIWPSSRWRMAPGARWTLPAAQSAQTRRQLYFFKGSALTLAGQDIAPASVIEVAGDQPAELHNGAQEAELLLLQGLPIGEPVAQYGPFVMNTAQEIQQAFADYRRTDRRLALGASDPVHPREQGRFALHPDGRRESRSA